MPLLNYLCCPALGKVLTLNDFIKKFTAIEQLCHKVDAALTLVNFVESYDVRMVEILQNGNLILETD